MDRRLTPANGRVAHLSLRGAVEADAYLEGEAREVAVPVTALLASPEGPMDRELLRGQVFHILEERGAHAFGFRPVDGYCGYVARADLGPALKPTHFVSVRQSYEQVSPDLKAWGPVVALSFGSRLEVVETLGAWSRVRAIPEDRFVPTAHLRPLSSPMSDPVAVARLFLGTPYRWGGNSSFGIDCSGLVQAALLACGIACPGDSDLQEKSLGRLLRDEEPTGRGDLLFWKGHVAMAVDGETLIHANATDMAVVLEPIEAAAQRIYALGEGSVTARRRL